MYFINFNKLTIEKAKSNLSSYYVDYDDIDFTYLKEAAAEIDRRMQNLDCYKGKKSPLSLNFNVGRCIDEDEFEDRVNIVLSSFALYNCTNEAFSGREYHYDCPREFIPYLNISRTYSKKLTNQVLKINSFNLNIKGGEFYYSLIDEDELETKGLKKVNAR